MKKLLNKHEMNELVKRGKELEIDQIEIHSDQITEMYRLNDLFELIMKKKK